MGHKRMAILCAAFVALLYAGPALAHHGAAAFDTSQSTTLKGTVVEFNFINPHCQLFINVTDDSGKVVEVGWRIHQSRHAAPARLDQGYVQARRSDYDHRQSRQERRHRLARNETSNVRRQSDHRSRRARRQLRIRVRKVRRSKRAGNAVERRRGVRELQRDFMRKYRMCAILVAARILFASLFHGAALEKSEPAGSRGGSESGRQPTCLDFWWCALRLVRFRSFAFTKEPSGMTAWAEEKYKAAKPASGPTKPPRNSPTIRFIGAFRRVSRASIFIRSRWRSCSCRMKS